MPLAFIEVKKPNNQDGMLAEQARINQRCQNRHFNKFFNLTQFMIFSNNMEYDDEGGIFQGAFYATPAIGNNAKVYFNHFREQKRSEFVDEIEPIAQATEDFILEDNNYQIIKNSPEYITNKDENTPTNRIISSLLSKPRLKFLLQYAFAFINPGGGEPQRQIMRYPQFLPPRRYQQPWIKVLKRA